MAFFDELYEAKTAEGKKKDPFYLYFADGDFNWIVPSRKKIEVRQIEAKRQRRGPIEPKMLKVKEA
jgi:hypothetical protein